MYDTGNVQLLQAVLRSSFQGHGGDAAYWQFPWSRLFKPLGARSFAFPTDAVGLFTGACCARLHAQASPHLLWGSLQTSAELALRPPSRHMLCERAALFGAGVAQLCSHGAQYSL